MSHSHHQHSYQSTKNTALYAAFFVALFGSTEALTGWWSGSLALLSDAGHMWVDALALFLAAFASWLKQQAATNRHTYGFGRIEVLVSWLSCTILLAVVINIAIEASHRLHTPSMITSEVVIIVATIGLIINIITAWILHRGEKTLNMRAALLHVLGDILGSIAVLVSGTTIYFTNWTLIDPILSLFICFLILIAIIHLLRESWLVLMETTPGHIDYTQVKSVIKSVDGVYALHDLHIWTITSNTVLLTVHVIVHNHRPWAQIISDIRVAIQKNFGITHSTIQIETQDQTLPCIDCAHK
ncbi:MAG: cation diffusion facilitator family transporter [Coxiellaceae bacterium]|jgi:cobalt-zinc-cadmium efflux system protein|nr:cation diffusion facilitator family transporter [Coxiellaceae bacterium]